MQGSCASFLLIVINVFSFLVLTLRLAFFDAIQALFVHNKLLIKQRPTNANDSIPDVSALNVNRPVADISYVRTL